MFYNVKTYVFIVFILCAMTVTAQGKWSATFRPVLKLPVNGLLDSDLRIGNGFELTGAYALMPHLEIYAGWGWASFDIDEDFDEENINFNEYGYTLGGRLTLPINKSKNKYFIKGGIVINSIEVETANNFKTKTDTSVGLQIGVGVEFLLYKHWSLVPEFRYRSLSQEITITNTPVPFDLRYTSLSVGLRYKFYKS